jgi:hypothetical protein
LNPRTLESLESFSNQNGRRMHRPLIEAEV